MIFGPSHQVYLPYGCLAARAAFFQFRPSSSSGGLLTKICTAHRLVSTKVSDNSYMGLAIKSLYAPSHHYHLYGYSAGFRTDLKRP